MSETSIRSSSPNQPIGSNEKPQKTDSKTVTWAGHGVNEKKSVPRRQLLAKTILVPAQQYSPTSLKERTKNLPPPPPPPGSQKPNLPIANAVSQTKALSKPRPSKLEKQENVQDLNLLITPMAKLKHLEEKMEREPLKDIKALDDEIGGLKWEKSKAPLSKEKEERLNKANEEWSKKPKEQIDEFNKMKLEMKNLPVSKMVDEIINKTYKKPEKTIIPQDFTRKISDKNAHNLANNITSKMSSLYKSAKTEDLLKQNTPELTKFRNNLTSANMAYLSDCKKFSELEKKTKFLLDTAHVLIQKGDFASATSIHEALSSLPPAAEKKLSKEIKGRLDTLNRLCTPMGNYKNLRAAMENHEHAIHPHPLFFRGIEAAGQNTNLSSQIEIFGKILSPLKGRSFLPPVQKGPVHQDFEKAFQQTKDLSDKDILNLQSQMKNNLKTLK